MSNNFKDADEDDVEISFARKKQETKKAILFKIDGEDVWVPKSQITEVHETDKVVVMSSWIAGEKGLT